MSRIIADGEVRAQWVPGESAIADPAAPTITEINTGSDITPELSMLDTPLDGEATASGDLSSAYRKTVAGNYGSEITLEGYRDDTNDVLYPLFPRNTRGFLVVRRFGGSDVAIAAADEVDVFSVRIVSRSPAQLGTGVVQMFTAVGAVGQEPSEGVTVAA